MTIRLADSNGRIYLGSQFANLMSIIDDVDPGQVILKSAVAIPAKEAWLYNNETALDLVRKGLVQAKKRQFAKSPPDLDVDVEFVKQLARST